MRRARTLLGTATAATFLALVALAPAGLPDARVLGYSPADIAQWAADPQMRARAMGPLFWLDMVFPALLAGFMLMLLAPGWRRGLPLAYGALDYAENLVLRVYYAGHDAGAVLSPGASALTQAKWAALAVASVMIIWPRLVRQGRAGGAR